MKQIMLLLSCFFLLTGSFVKAQNVVYDANAEVRKVGDFNGVEVSGGISLYLSQGNQQAVAVSASEEKYISRIKTEVRGGVLKIFIEPGAWNSWNWGNKKIKAYVTVTALKSLHAGGASSIKVTGDLHSDDLDVDVSGSSSLQAAIQGKNLKIDISGASAANLSGLVETMKLEVSGASSLKAIDLITVSCKAEVSGASVANITVNKELDAEASGASSIGYHGDAVIKRVDVSGASSIKKKD
ncbi:head GIN domain-containing protein [Deminuibacter soli]|uniref:DUF2807 domain-containing protein n=1 Tax=Deminuibacter soli TaxID=2291815 RepID=A0A3E1NLU0_9BACT|nr:head GIN domain-containing protein [Deminuibacter soli]RFM28883.1 DUF2807 domain-containing protein [Deminuibacter soli]